MIDITNNPDKRLSSLVNVDSQRNKELLIKKTELTARKYFLKQFFIIKNIFPEPNNLTNEAKKD